MSIHTLLARGGAVPGEPHGATAPPIYQTATFAQESAMEFGAYDYSRSGNPTRDALQDLLARLEGGTRALAFASGLAAHAAVLGLLSPGDRVVACTDLYGGSYRLLDLASRRRGIVVSYADLSESSEIERAIVPGVRMVHVETPSNPLLRVTDLAALAARCRACGAWLVVDSTAMSPYLQRPLELGADIVLHSATKLLNGHADVSAGVAVTRDEAIGRELAFVQNAEGAGLAPMDCALLLRGVRTLALRLDRQQASALAVARALEDLPGIREVRFPGLASFDGASVHRRQASGPGVLVVFRTGDLETSRRLVEALELFSISVSFGGVASSASLPGRMSHKSIPASVRAERSFPEDLVRLSVGIEDPCDLIDDLRRAASIARGGVSGPRPEPGLPERAWASACR